jgi:hypothetical protein
VLVSVDWSLGTEGPPGVSRTALRRPLWCLRGAHYGAFVCTAVDFTKAML